MTRLFGTDGIRGVANKDLTVELALSVGRAVPRVLCEDVKKDEKITVVIGKDTRQSSDMLEAAIIAGLTSSGADVICLGVIPTPAVPYLLNRRGATAGIMITASHNPYEYNGIKIFGSDGYKLDDSVEDEIEKITLSKENIFKSLNGNIGIVSFDERAVDDYVSYLRSTIDINLRGMKLAIDCANGAASATARKLFESLEANCVFLNEKPDGKNINYHCGSTYIEKLAKYVRTGNYFAGVAFDGDADRVLVVDEKGNVLDGDKIMAIFSHDLKKRGKLKNNTVVVTVMSNLGLLNYFENCGVDVDVTQVGDRYVLESMREHGHSLGGEQSGHIILNEYSFTGDGQMAAIHLLTYCRQRGKKLSVAGEIMETYPQVMINVAADTEQKEKYKKNAKLKEDIAKVQELLGKSGRVLVRPSGTEPLIRVMLEGKSFDEINKIALKIVEEITEEIK